MEGTDPTAPVPAEQVAKLRRLTCLPWMDCKRLLESLTVAERERYIATAETRKGGIQHDPIEDDPAIRPLFLAVFEEATREVQEWHRQYVAELEQRCPTVAELVRSGRGLNHRTWVRVKEMLRERHGIEWRSPQEMNPGVVFD